MSDLTIILRSLLARRFSTIVTVASVALAVALLMALLMLRDSGQAAFSRGSGNAHLLVSQDNSPLVAVLNGVFYANPPRNPISQAKFAEIKNAFPWAWAIPTQLGDSYKGFPVVATTTEYLSDFEPVEGEPWQFAKGRPFDAPFELVIGSEVARATGLQLGDAIPLTHGFASSRETGHVHDAHTFEVVGILEPTVSSHDRAMFTDLVGSWVLHAEDRLEREGGEDDSGHDHGHHHAHVDVEDLTDEDRLVTGILLRVPTRGGSASAVLPQAFDLLRRDTSITVASPANQIQRLFAIVGSVDRLFIAMAIVVLASSGVGILLALWNSMEQRRRQIAILRVLGCSRARVFGLIVSESVLIGLFGAIIGVGLSFAAAAMAAREVRDRLGLVLDPQLGIELIILILAGTVLLAVVAGLAPALRAYNTPVARSLRPLV